MLSDHDDDDDSKNDSSSLSCSLDKMPIQPFLEAFLNVHIDENENENEYNPVGLEMTSKIEYLEKRMKSQQNNIHRQEKASNLSQSTQTEIPRKALLAATIAKGTDNVVMLVGSAAAPRWKKSEVKDAITSTVESFKGTPSPKFNLKVRIKRRGDELINF